ncbi:MAG: ATP-binding protein [Deltaproteobacteria bacterium]|nr:ATP-binding protein [Deltaproteobacteria bacterium]
MAREVLRHRYLEAVVAEDALAAGKMAFISGPRQVGKTTVGRFLLQSEQNVFNWDDQRFRKKWVKDPVESVADRGPGPVLLDEIHKDRRWKGRLKGLFDLRGDDVPIVVTGSARLDYFRKGGDSLLGRYIPYRLHPFSVGEALRPPEPDRILERRDSVFPLEDLMALGTFPEPLLGGSAQKAARWSRLRMERLVKEDLRDLRSVRDVEAVRVLGDLLADRVGSLLSVNGLREDVQVAYATVRDWVGMLQMLYHCFVIRPYSRKLHRVLTAGSKLYLYDVLQVESEPARRENLVALHLLKAVHYWTDAALGEFDLMFLRTRDGKEVDFIVTRDRKPWMLVECKSGQTAPDKALVEYARLFSTRHNYQVVSRKGHDRYFPEHKVRVLGIDRFLAGLV